MAWLNVSLTTAVEESEAHSASADERGSTARE